MTWEHTAMLLVLGLTTYTGVKLIDLVFDKLSDNKKKKNSLF